MGTRRATLRAMPARVHDVDHAFDVLVGDRRLLGELGVRRAAHDDAACLELAAQLVAVDLSLGRAAAHRASGAVARAGQRQVARRIGADEHEGSRAHAARDEHRLADGAVAPAAAPRSTGPNARVAPLRCTQSSTSAEVLSIFADVVRDVVDEPRDRCRARPASTRANTWRTRCGDHLAIAPTRSSPPRTSPRSSARPSGDDSGAQASWRSGSAMPWRASAWSMMRT